ncbi:hypothetical protein EET67_21970 [Pseudaminobacter arsenicus]|uniref:Uncharacterized protein n=1 Tax=Borborobacter arsenicus TaxID=1851146 RepID=A0A432V099_9HYPH|nr:hypothetical protein EET67_21970 [Pseudaminobacter arsenicus]
MKGGYLNGKLECKTCGTITLMIPTDADEFTMITCSKCGEPLGMWGDLQDEFARQAREATVLELSGGRIRKTRTPRHK